MATVLIIDDNPQMAELIQEMVRIVGYETILTDNAPDGLAQARDQEPDAILLDLMMPEYDGWEVYDQLRAFTDAPIFFVTAHNTPANVARAKELGAAGMLGKILTPIDLAQRLRQALGE
ncbi:MAG TPA: response regulator [Anaerolineae bacterium]|nr:response regulator [Anaerolineae bacterium]